MDIPFAKCALRFVFEPVHTRTTVWTSIAVKGAHVPRLPPPTLLVVPSRGSNLQSRARQAKTRNGRRCISAQFSGQRLSSFQTNRLIVAVLRLSHRRQSGRSFNPDPPASWASLSLDKESRSEILRYPADALLNASTWVNNDHSQIEDTCRAVIFVNQIGADAFA